MKRKQQKTENLSCLFHLFDYNRNKTNKKDAYTKKKLLEHFKSSFLIKKRQKKRSN